MIYNSINNYNKIRSCTIFICESWNAPDFCPSYSVLFNSHCYKGHKANPDQNILDQVQRKRY